MADILLAKPSSNQTVTITPTPEDRIVFQFDPSEALLERVEDNLVLSFEDGSVIELSDFYVAYTSDNMPEFVIGDAIVPGESFFAALSEELMPAAGPSAAGPQGSGSGVGLEGGSLFGGIDRIGSLDQSFDIDAFTTPTDTDPLVNLAPTIGGFVILTADGLTSSDESIEVIESGVGRDANGDVIASEPNKEFAGELTISGRVIASDPDGDQLTYSIVDGSSQYGTLSLNPTTGEFTFTLNDSAANSLGQNDRFIEEFLIQVSDGQGGTAQGVLEVAVVGTNDKPTIGFDDGSGDFAFIEYGVGRDKDGELSDNPNQAYKINKQDNVETGKLEFDDVDNNHELSFSVTLASNTLNGADLKGITPKTVGDEIVLNDKYGTFRFDTETGEYSYEIKRGSNNNPVHALDQDDKLVKEFVVTVTDEHGASSAETIVVTITGTNDMPTLTLKDGGSLSVKEDVTLVDSSIATARDADDSDNAKGEEDSLTFYLGTGAVQSTKGPLDLTDLKAEGSTLELKYGSVTIDSKGNYNYTLNNNHPDVQALGEGDPLPSETFNIYVKDEFGAWVTKAVTVNITGTNDYPEIVSTSSDVALNTDDSYLTNGTSRDATKTSDNGLITFTSVESMDGGKVTIGDVEFTFSKNTDGTYSFTPSTAVSKVGGYGDVTVKGLEEVEAGKFELSYTYTQNSAANHSSGAVSESFDVLIQDAKEAKDSTIGATTTITVSIADDTITMDNKINNVDTDTVRISSEVEGSLGSASGVLSTVGADALTSSGIHFETISIGGNAVSVAAGQKLTLADGTELTLKETSSNTFEAMGTVDGSEKAYFTFSLAANGTWKVTQHESFVDEIKLTFGADDIDGDSAKHTVTVIGNTLPVIESVEDTNIGFNGAHDVNGNRIDSADLTGKINLKDDAEAAKFAVKFDGKAPIDLVPGEETYIEGLGKMTISADGVYSIVLDDDSKQNVMYDIEVAAYDQDGDRSNFVALNANNGEYEIENIATLGASTGTSYRVDSSNEGINDTLEINLTGKIAGTPSALNADSGGVGEDYINMGKGNDYLDINIHSAALSRGMRAASGGNNKVDMGDGNDEVNIFLTNRDYTGGVENLHGMYVASGIAGNLTQNLISTAGSDSVVTDNDKVIITVDSQAVGNAMNAKNNVTLSNIENKIETGAGNDTVVLEASSIAMSAFAGVVNSQARNIIETGTGEDFVSITGGEYAMHTDPGKPDGNKIAENRISTGEGDDTIMLDGKLSGALIDGGADDDVLILANSFDHNTYEFKDMDDGTDALWLKGAKTEIDNVESFEFDANAQVIDFSRVTGDGVTINGGGGADSIYGSQGDDLIFMNAQDVFIDGGLGMDILLVGVKNLDGVKEMLDNGSIKNTEIIVSGEVDGKNNEDVLAELGIEKTTNDKVKITGEGWSEGKDLGGFTEFTHDENDITILVETLKLETGAG